MATVRTKAELIAEFEGNKVCVWSLKVQPTLVSKIKEIQKTDKYLQTYLVFIFGKLLVYAVSQ